MSILAGMVSRNRTIQDWEDAALLAIAKEGMASLAIPKLARSLDQLQTSDFIIQGNLIPLLLGGLRDRL